MGQRGYSDRTLYINNEYKRRGISWKAKPKKVIVLQNEQYTSYEYYPSSIKHEEFGVNQ